MICTLDEFIKKILDSKGRNLRFCFDVDGVLCDDSDWSKPYADRPPYPWVSKALKAIKAFGHTIIIQTARGMAKYEGNQKLAEEGKQTLIDWLTQHDIPYDEVYMGKASAHIYIDDRACRVNSNDGIIEWFNILNHSEL